MTYYLAIDIGASSGKFILGSILNEKLHIEEIYRFDNKSILMQNCEVWDVEHLLAQVMIGLKRCVKHNKIPKYIGIDTFGVDYCLLDQDNNIIGDVYSYRDNRTITTFQKFHKILSEADYFRQTAIQPQPFNTLYQLYHDKITKKINKDVKFVMLSSYIAYYLTGVLYNESTIFSTTGLIDINTKTISDKLLNILDIHSTAFPKLVNPGNIIGNFKESIANEIGFTSTIVAVCQHDTASAVVGSNADEETLFLSSGTWSLIGTLSENPINNLKTYMTGFSNELGFNNLYRVLKNITGLWMIQKVKSENHPNLSIEDIIDLASKSHSYTHTIDVCDEVFINPKSMTETIKMQLTKNELPLFDSIGELYFLIYNSLAKSYAQAIKEIESITNKSYLYLNIVGGGSQNQLLNDLTAQHTKKQLITGPTEATAIGNIIVQMIVDNKISYETKNKWLKSLRKGE